MGIFLHLRQRHDVFVQFVGSSLFRKESLVDVFTNLSDVRGNNLFKSGYVGRRNLNLDEHTDIKLRIRQLVRVCLQLLAEGGYFAFDKGSQFLPIVHARVLIGICFQ